MLHHLWCHRQVSTYNWFWKLILLQKFSKTEICKFDLEVFSYENIAKFYISVYYPMLSKLNKRISELTHNLFGSLLRKTWTLLIIFFVFIDIPCEVCEFTMFKNQVDMSASLFKINQLNNIGMFQERQNIQLLVYALQVFFSEVN